jgi:aminoglycoside/choline kinase family phosphotransferase
MGILEKMFEKHFRTPVRRAEPVQGGLGASGRTIIRLTGEKITAIGVEYSVREENKAFLGFSRHFRRHGLPVPEIYVEDLKHGAYLEEDLGDTTLFQFLSDNRSGDSIAPAVVAAYRKAAEVLPRFQIEAGRDLDYRLCYPRRSFDRQSIAWDLNYFKYHFLKLAGVPFNEQGLEADFRRLTKFLLAAPRDHFMYRDFQSRNIMLRDGEPWFVDYQGGRKGALQYDVASLLFDAKADLPPLLRQELLEHYLQLLPRYADVSRDAFLEHYYAFVYVRVMQALGTYGFRGIYGRKPHFLQSVPYALKNLRWLIENVELPVAVPALLAVFRRMVESDALRALVPPQTAEAPPVATGGTKLLTVRIFSFSFHQGGPPADESGHGGGFVFDLRAVPNPGREARFKALTGNDAPVIEYLEAQASAREFLANVRALVEASVREYQRRGFDNLMVSFGCTGGQHRSVYMAERLAQALRGKPGVEVIVRHLGLDRLRPAAAEQRAR